jgi:nucleotide-binding universal stress UspA family protein
LEYIVPPIKNVLCPVDLSPASLRAFDYSVILAQHYDAALHILHVIAPVINTADDFYVDTRKLLASIQKQAEPEIRRLRKVAVNAGIKTDSEIRTGDVGTEIIDAIKRNRADIVVMGKGRRALERWLVGSVTDHLLRRLSIPMFIISEGKTKRAAPPAMKRILITTDLSDGSRDAITYAMSLAKESQASMALLHVLPMAAVGVALPFEATPGQLESEMRRLLPEDTRGDSRLVTKIASGIPYQEILNFAQANKPDLIVMNIHGKGAFERLLLGSNAERVIRGASCPVLVVPPRRGKGAKKR